MNTRKFIKTNIRKYLNEDVSIAYLINKLTKKYHPYEYYIDGEKKLTKIVYIRFGLPRTNDLNKIVASKRHVFGKEVYDEAGVSVFEVLWDGKNIIYIDRSSALNSAFDELWHQGRKIYLLDGEIDYKEEGSDGELLMKPDTVRIITEIPRDMILIK